LPVNTPFWDEHKEAGFAVSLEMGEASGGGTVEEARATLEGPANPSRLALKLLDVGHSFKHTNDGLPAIISQAGYPG